MIDPFEKAPLEAQEETQESALEHKELFQYEDSKKKKKRSKKVKAKSIEQQPETIDDEEQVEPDFVVEEESEAEPEQEKKAKKRRFSLRQGFGRKFLPVVILLGAGVVLLALSIVLRVLNPENNADNKVNEIPVVTHTASDIKSISVRNAADQYVMRKKAGDNYLIEKYDSKPVSDDTVSVSFTSLAAITTTNEIMVDEAKLKDYGLAEPVATVTIQTGTKTTEIYLGNQKSSTDGKYFFYVKDHEKNDPDKKQVCVFLMKETVANLFLADHFYYYEQNISGYESSVDSVNAIKIGGTKGTAVSVKMAAEDTGLSYMMTSPIEMPFSTSAMTDINSLLSALTGAIAVSDDVSAKGLKNYGLDEPSYRLEYDDGESTQVILFGDEKDGRIYCMPHGGKAIYQIDAAYAACMSLDIRNMCDAVTYTRDASTVSNIRLITKEKTFDIEINGTGENRLVYVNNREVNNSIFADFYVCLLDVEVNGVLEGKKPAGDPFLTIEVTLSEDGSKEYLRYYEVDARHMYYELNGTGMFTVKNQEIEDIITNAQKLYDNEELTIAW